MSVPPLSPLTTLKTFAAIKTPITQELETFKAKVQQPEIKTEQGTNKRYSIATAVGAAASSAAGPAAFFGSLKNLYILGNKNVDVSSVAKKAFHPSVVPGHFAISGFNFVALDALAKAFVCLDRELPDTPHLSREARNTLVAMAASFTFSPALSLLDFWLYPKMAGVNVTPEQALRNFQQCPKEIKAIILVSMTLREFKHTLELTKHANPSPTDSMQENKDISETIKQRIIDGFISMVGDLGVVAGILWSSGSATAETAPKNMADAASRLAKFMPARIKQFICIWAFQPYYQDLAKAIEQHILDKLEPDQITSTKTTGSIPQQPKPTVTP